MRKKILARDLNVGDIVEIDGSPVTLEMISWADGRDGRPFIQKADLPNHSKSALWKVLNFSVFVHPASEMVLIIT